MNTLPSHMFVYYIAESVGGLDLYKQGLDAPLFWSTGSSGLEDLCCHLRVCKTFNT
jgi:hypothetical protein